MAPRGMAPRRSMGRSMALLIAIVSLTQLQYWWPASTSTSTAPCPATAFAEGENYYCNSKSEWIRHPLHIGVYWSRFYDHWVGPADMSRQGIRIGGMENYAVCSSVMLQVLVGFYSGVQEEIGGTKLDKILFEVQMGLLMIAVLTSTFTMVMFLLNKICAVSALGLYKDVAYATFRQATARHRSLAFWSLIASVICFVASFAIDLFRRLEGNKGLAAKIITGVIGTWMLYQWSSIMTLADDQIFQGASSGGYA